MNWTLDLNEVLMLVLVASQMLFAIGRWTQGREATGKDIDRLEKLLHEEKAARERQKDQHHSKMNEIQRMLAELTEDFVSKETFSQFARRYEILEARYNSQHNGNH